MNTQTILVSSGITVPGYDSFSQAIEASNKVRAEKRSQCELVNRQVVVDYRFNGSSLSIKFENNYYLAVSAGINSIDWEVTSSPPIFEKSLPAKCSVIFELSNGARFFWNWKAILGSIVGKQIKILPSDQFLFIAVREDGEYMFDFLVDNVDPSRRYLYISRE